MNFANVIQLMSTNTGTLGSQLQATATQPDSSFHLLLEQRINVQSLGSQLQAEIPESNELFNELHTLLHLLLQLTEDEFTELFGLEATEKLSSEFVNWQIEVREQSKLPLDSVLGKLLALFTIPVERNGDAQTIPLQSLNKEAKHMVLRLLQLLETVSNQTTERLFKFQKLEEQPVSPQESKLAQLRKVISQISESSQHTTSNFSQKEDTSNRFTLQSNVSFHQTSMDRVHQLEWRISLLNEPEAPSLVEQFEKILTSSRIRTFKNGLTELNVRLHPEHFGSLTIKLTQQDGNLIARITAQTEAAKNLLESQLHQLRHAFVTQNIQVEKVEILTESNGQQQQRQDDQANSEQQEQNAMLKRDGSEDIDQNDEEQTFKDWFQSLLL